MELPQKRGYSSEGGNSLLHTSNRVSSSPLPSHFRFTIIHRWTASRQNFALRTSSLSLSARASAFADALLARTLALSAGLLCPRCPAGQIAASAPTGSSPLDSIPDKNRPDDIAAGDDAVEFGEYPAPGYSELEAVEKGGDGLSISCSPSPTSLPSSWATDKPRDFFQSGTYSSLQVDGSWEGCGAEPGARGDISFSSAVGVFYNIVGSKE